MVYKCILDIDGIWYIINAYAVDCLSTDVGAWATVSNCQGKADLTLVSMPLRARFFAHATGHCTRRDSG